MLKIVLGKFCNGDQVISSNENSPFRVVGSIEIVMDTSSWLYYFMLLPSTLIVFVICLFLRWMGLKFFRHN
ncbi:hypothetical protein MAR_033552 [Mya arenaria]|uniref:ATP synthase F0 subunit 8 n=1 Tax=Mya arenaria TaxID=6604 RepID=A0ABY7G9D1_MYAAR|nr:hypothetical protein MAR_033552 [Mya arenaria]